MKGAVGSHNYPVMRVPWVTDLRRNGHAIIISKTKYKIVAKIEETEKLYTTLFQELSLYSELFLSLKTVCAWRWMQVTFSKVPVQFWCIGKCLKMVSFYAERRWLKTIKNSVRSCGAYMVTRICNERSVSECCLSTWNQLAVNQRLQLFVHSLATPYKFCQKTIIMFSQHIN